MTVKIAIAHCRYVVHSACIEEYTKTVRITKLVIGRGRKDSALVMKTLDLLQV